MPVMVIERECRDRLGRDADPDADEDGTEGAWPKTLLMPPLTPLSCCAACVGISIQY